MSKDRHVSETPASAWLRRNGIPFREHVYDYVDRGGTAESARQLGVDEHRVVKTRVIEDENRRPLIVRMHGDRNVATLCDGLGVARLTERGGASSRDSLPGARPIGASAATPPSARGRHRVDELRRTSERPSNEADRPFSATGGR